MIQSYEFHSWHYSPASFYHDFIQELQPSKLNGWTVERLKVVLPKSCEVVAFLDFALADGNFGDLEGVPLLFTQAAPLKHLSCRIASLPRHFASGHESWNLSLCKFWDISTFCTRGHFAWTQKYLEIVEICTTSGADSNEVSGWRGLPAPSAGLAICIVLHQCLMFENVHFSQIGRRWTKMNQH